MAPGILIDSPPSPAAASTSATPAASPALAKHGAATATTAERGQPPVGGEEEQRPQRRRLPVTLLSGFLGAGKTTLLERVLTSRDHGLRVGVIVNDVGALNIDAALLANHGHDVTRKRETIVAMQNGCICCTLRGDLLEEVARLADDGCVDYLLIESSGVSEPMQVAEAFSEEFAEMHIAAGYDLESEIKEDNDNSADDVDAEAEKRLRLAEILKAGGLSRIARLDTCVTMVDAVNFMSDFHTADFLADRQANRADLPDEDDRNISDLQVDQVEFADVVVINKCDLVAAAEVDRIRGVVAQLNPGAGILTTTRARLDMSEILDTKLFSYENAALAAGWLRSLGEETEITPETEEYGIGTFVYRARRPFHPARLWETIGDVFVVVQEEMVAFDEDGEEMVGDEDGGDDEDMEDVEDDDDEEAEEQPQLDPKKRLAAKMAHEAFGPLLRSKGFLWLATRSRMFGEWSQAGVMLTIKNGDVWRCEMSEEDLFSSLGEDPAARAVVHSEIEKGGRWGDRRQELVFIGQEMGEGRQRIQDAIDACLLDDEEFRAWERVMEQGGDDVDEKLAGLFEDGFEDWAEPHAHHEHDHDHDHDEDGQCIH